MHLEEYTSETFILLLTENGTENHSKNLINWKILIKNIIAQVIMMLVLIKMMLSVKNRKDFGKIKAGLIK